MPLIAKISKILNGFVRNSLAFNKIRENNVYMFRLIYVPVSALMYILKNIENSIR